MSSSEMSAAQISSRVLSGLEPHSTSDAPARLRHRASAPVSGVRCSEPAMRIPSSGRAAFELVAQVRQRGHPALRPIDERSAALGRFGRSCHFPMLTFLLLVGFQFVCEAGKQRALLVDLPILPIGRWCSGSRVDRDRPRLGQRSLEVSEQRFDDLAERARTGFLRALRHQCIDAIPRRRRHRDSHRARFEAHRQLGKQRPQPSILARLPSAVRYDPAAFH